MQDRNARAEKSSTFDPDEPPTAPFAHTLGPLVRPTPPRSMKIRKVNAPLGASQKKVLQRSIAKPPSDDAPTLRPPPPTPIPTMPAPPRASSPPLEAIAKAIPVIVIPADLLPPPPPPSADVGTTTKTMQAITPAMRGALPEPSTFPAAGRSPSIAEDPLLEEREGPSIQLMGRPAEESVRISWT